MITLERTERIIILLNIIKKLKPASACFTIMKHIKRGATSLVIRENYRIYKRSHLLPFSSTNRPDKFGAKAIAS